MNGEKDINSLISTDNTCNNLIKNQESESTMYNFEDNSTVSNYSENNEHDNESKHHKKYIVFSKWTWKSLILSIIAIIVLIILTFYIIKHYLKKSN